MIVISWILARNTYDRLTFLSTPWFPSWRHYTTYIMTSYLRDLMAVSSYCSTKLDMAWIWVTRDGRLLICACFNILIVNTTTRSCSANNPMVKRLGLKRVSCLCNEKVPGRLGLFCLYINADVVDSIVVMHTYSWLRPERRYTPYAFRVHL